MDEAHLIAAARYVPMNPVRARLVARPADWLWSSARAHLTGRDDGLVATTPLLERIGDFATFLAAGEDPSAAGALRAPTGRSATKPSSKASNTFLAASSLVADRDRHRSR
jgi:putative transposase